MVFYVVGFCIFLPTNEVVLIKKEKPAWQKGLLNGVGGKVEIGEVPSEAMVREFKEETGVKTQEKDWTLLSCLEDELGTCNFYFMKSREVLPVRSMEKEQIVVVPASNLPDNVVYNLRWMIPLANDPFVKWDVMSFFRLSYPVNR